MRRSRIPWGIFFVVVLGLGGRVLRLGSLDGFASPVAWLVYLLLAAFAVWIGASMVRGRTQATCEELQVRTAFHTRTYARRDMSDAVVVGVDPRKRPRKRRNPQGAANRMTVIRGRDGRCLARLAAPVPAAPSPTVVDALEAMGVPVDQLSLGWTSDELDAYAPGAATWSLRHRGWFVTVVGVATLAFFYLVGVLSTASN